MCKFVVWGCRDRSLRMKPSAELNCDEHVKLAIALKNSGDAMNCLLEASIDHRQVQPPVHSLVSTLDLIPLTPSILNTPTQHSVASAASATFAAVAAAAAAAAAAVAATPTAPFTALLRTYCRSMVASASSTDGAVSCRTSFGRSDSGGGHSMARGTHACI